MCSRQRLMSGSVSAAPSTSPSRSAIQVQFSSRTGFRFLEYWRDLGLVQRARRPSCAPRPRCRPRGSAPSSDSRSLLPHVADRHPVLARHLLRGGMDHRMEAALLLDLVEAQLPHVEVHRLLAARSPRAASGSRGGASPARTIGLRSWPSTSRPHSSLVVKSIGPDHAVAPALAQPVARRLQQGRGRPRDRPRTRRTRTGPTSLPWNSLKLRSTWALIRPTGSPVAPGQEQLDVGVLEERVLAPVQELPAAPRTSGGTQFGSLR